MASHLSSIGLAVSDQDAFAEIIEQLGPLATPIEVDGGHYWQWSSGCGAELWLQTNDDDEFVGWTPYFAGDGRVKVRLTARVSRANDSPMDGTFHGWADPDDGESGAYPFVFDVPDHARYSELETPVIVTAQIAAFAHEVSIYPSVEAYDNAQAGEMKFASQSFIPSGLFSDADDPTTPQSHAILTGHIRVAAEKTNSLTGEGYYWALVDSLGGSFDVVIDPTICEAAPEAGGVLSGSFWLCGRLLPLE